MRSLIRSLFSIDFEFVRSLRVFAAGGIDVRIGWREQRQPRELFARLFVVFRFSGAAAGLMKKNEILNGKEGQADWRQF